MFWELKRGSIVPAGGKTGKWRWSGLISFVSRCIHFVFFPTPTPPLSVKPLIRNWTPQWQIEPAIKGRKRKALLSAADWDPRLPSHNRGGYVCVCVCAYMRVYAWYRANSRADTTTSSPSPPAPSLQVFPRLTCLLRALSKQTQIDAAVLPSLALTHVHHVMKPQRKTYIHTGELPLTEKKEKKKSPSFPVSPYWQVRHV